MTDINTGTGDFPTAAQVSGGLYLPKSSAATAREWYAVATDRDIYFWVNYSGTSSAAAFWFWGDITSYKSGDAYHTAFIAATAAASAAGNGVGSSNVGSMVSALAGNYIARSYAQSGTSVTAGKHGNTTAMKVDASFGGAGETYPSPVTGGLLYTPIYVTEAAAVVTRGKLPGVLAPLHLTPLTHADTFTGTGDYAGKTFLVLNCYTGAQVFLEISNTR
jgi:hypothetical protein